MQTQLPRQTYKLLATGSAFNIIKTKNSSFAKMSDEDEPNHYPENELTFRPWTNLPDWTPLWFKAVAWTMVIVTWPIYLVHSRPKLKKLDRRRKPEPLVLKARDSGMTLALKREVTSRTESQLLSLPKEIREMIFNQVMGGMRICLALSEAERKLMAWRHDYYEECTGFRPYAICTFTSFGRRKLGVFGLLLSCRLM
jgi:hypothetical protein